MKRDKVICLFDETGIAGKPWADAGYDVLCLDIKNQNTHVGSQWFLYWDAKQPYSITHMDLSGVAFVMGFPPCTDLAVSGAAHFAKKKAANPKYREEAMQMVHIVDQVGRAAGCPYFIENPVSVISTEWRKPDYMFHPWEYGGYLPEGDVHPMYSDYIEPRDAYPKKTCYWTGGGFVMPPKKPVPVAEGYSIQHRKLGGKSEKTKKIRSASPRGIAQAIFETYGEKL